MCGTDWVFTYDSLYKPLQSQWSLYVPPGLTFTNSTFIPHSVFMCFVWISEQTAIISSYNINWLVFITETESVYSAVRTEYLYIILYIKPSKTSDHYMYRTMVTIHVCTAQWSLYVPPGLTFTNSTFIPHSVFMCFVWIWEKTAIISLYNINWLVFITETESVYSAVRTEYLYIILYIKPSKASGHYMYRTMVTICTAQLSLYVPPALTFTNSPFCPHSVFMCFVWISEQTAIISLYSVNWSVL